MLIYFGPPGSKPLDVLADYYSRRKVLHHLPLHFTVVDLVSDN